MEWTKIPTDLLQSATDDKDILAIVKYQLLWAMLEREPEEKICLRYMTSKQLQRARDYTAAIQRRVNADISSVVSHRNRQKMFYLKNQTLTVNCDGQCDGQCDGADKIREDNIIKKELIKMQCLDKKNNNAEKKEAIALENNLKNINASDVEESLNDITKTQKQPLRQRLNKKNPPTPLKIEWDVIHLTYDDFDKWFKLSKFKNQGDFIGWLSSREDWLKNQSESVRKNWFFSTSKEIFKLGIKNDK